MTMHSTGEQRGSQRSVNARGGDIVLRAERPRALPDPLAGTPYRTVRRLGGGSTSDVFEAIRPGGDRCAVKVLREALEGGRLAAFRLDRERRTLGALDHPSLARVLDAGVLAGGRPYFVMRLLAGETLRSCLVRRGALPRDRALGVIADVLDGLDAAHCAGLVHRDVKPGNVFLSAATASERRRAMLLDFGIAAVRGLPSDLTTGSHVLGTPRYLSPEQILGGAVDARTDVYAAGLVLFEALTGQSPFDATSPLDFMRAHLHEEPRRLRSLCPASSRLERVVARALSKPPAQRWPSARAFAVAVAQVRSEESGLCN
jgi:eukaryotic-like serine/threonine-protein kinase